MKKTLDLSVKIGKEVFPGCVWAASGTFGNVKEFADFVDLSKIGAAVTKTITMEPREGNTAPRLVETPSGLVNSIGLANPGVEYFTEEIYPQIEKLPVKTIVSIAGCSDRDIILCAEKLLSKISPAALELNLSCPNVEHSSSVQLFAQDKDLAGLITRAVRMLSPVPLIVKLSPMVADIAGVAAEIERSGADAVALVNTYPALPIDAEKMAPILGNKTGGLSGPAIKVMALKAVNDVYAKVKLPIVGIGGISSGTDAAEFLLAGASCVQVGTSNFVNPDSSQRINEELREYMIRKGITKIKDLTGKLKG